MFAYSFPNNRDDFRTRATYVLAAEFIYRLDAFLEDEQERVSADGSIPVEMAHVVTECASLAVGMLHNLEDAWANPADTGPGEFFIRPESLAAMRPDTAEILRGAVRAVNAVPEETAPGCDTHSASPLKAHLVATLGKEFFARLAALCDSVTERADQRVGEHDVTIVRACVDAAMGMLHELKLATWPEGSEVPAKAVLAMHDHAISYRLECAGPVAMGLMKEVYDAVVQGLKAEA